MEGLAAASAIIAVVSLAGQVAQGCRYLRDVFESARNAPKEIRLLTNELAIIEGIVLDTPDANLHQEELEFCFERLSKLSQVVSKYGDLESAGHARKWGKRLAMAMSTDRIEKHLRSLREAKGYLQSIQNLCAHEKTIAESHKILETVEQISTAQFEAARIMSRTEGKLDDLTNVTRKTQDALHDLADRLVHRDTITRSWAQQNVERLVIAVEGILQHRLEEHRSKQDDIRHEGVRKTGQKNIGHRGLPPPYSEKVDNCANSTSVVVRRPRRNPWELQTQVSELSEEFGYASWTQKDLPPFIEKISRYNMPMGQIFMRTVSTTYSSASEMERVELPACFHRVHPAHFPVTITMTEIVLLSQDIVQGHGAVIRQHDILGPASRTSDVTYEMKEFNRPPSPPFQMGHQSTANSDDVGCGASMKCIEKLALGIVQRLRDFLPSSPCVDRKVPYAREAHFSWKLNSKPFRRREQNDGRFFPVIVL